MDTNGVILLDIDLAEEVDHFVLEDVQVLNTI